MLTANVTKAVARTNTGPVLKKTNLLFFRNSS